MQQEDIEVLEYIPAQGKKEGLIRVNVKSYKGGQSLLKEEKRWIPF